jgi:hypothetical protein
MKDKFKDFFDPNRSLVLFILGTASLTLVLQTAYDIASDPTVFQGGYVLSIVSLLVVVFVLFVSWRRSKTGEKVLIKEADLPGQRKGLILVASTNPGGPEPNTINYHVGEQNHLEYLWIISTEESGLRAAKLAQEYSDKVKNIYHGSNYLVDGYQATAAYSRVIQAINEARKAGLSKDDLIADITGGTKPITTGMSIACLAQEIDMEYLVSVRDGDGNVVNESSSAPIVIDTTYNPWG